MVMSKSARAARTHAYLAYLAMFLSIIAIAASVVSYTHVNTIYINQTKTVYISASNTTAQNVILSQYSINSTLITPLYYLPSYPPITASNTYSGGTTLKGLNAQLNASDLAVINNASDSYFEKAGEMYLNRSLSNTVSATTKSVPEFLVNGKPSVIYLGSITCIFCGENRWAMALALSRFGNFSALFTGYSSIGDGDVPTLYWSPATYNESNVDLGSFYSSRYINFLAVESTDPITGGFNLQPLAQMQQMVNTSGNLAYMDAFRYIMQIDNFQGTPYTIWGGHQVSGADAVDFGNSTATAPRPFSNWTHAQVFSLLSSPNSQFAWTEYAAADLYIAMACSSLNNTAPICQLPAIAEIEKANGY